MLRFPSSLLARLPRSLRERFPGGSAVPEHRSARPWRGSDPDHIVLIRLEAIGDVIATFPIAAALRDKYPRTKLTLVVGSRAAPVAHAVTLFDAIVEVPRGKNPVESRWQAGLASRHVGRCDVVLDLQRNATSRIIRRFLRAKAWGEFDRFSNESGIIRELRAVSDAGLGPLTPKYAVHLRADLAKIARDRLIADGWAGEPLVLLNPAGAMESRQWPRERWLELANLWPEARWLLTGDARMASLAAEITAAHPHRTHNYVGSSSLLEGFALVHQANAAVSEDGAFLHTAWLAGIPVVALFGGMRSDWTRPQTANARWLGSEDLPCGPCMTPTCARGDRHCLTRTSANEVLSLLHEAIATP